MKVRKVEIVEEPDCWSVTSVGVYQTAVEALRAVQDQDREAAEDRVTVIEWTTKTKVGKAVCTVLAGR
jgi:hypothetical protein